MVRTQIYLPQSQLDFLRARARKYNSTVSEEVRRAVICLESPETEPATQQSAGEWLMSLAKEAKRLKIKGPKDLSTNLDKYLYGSKK